MRVSLSHALMDSDSEPRVLIFMPLTFLCPAWCFSLRCSCCVRSRFVQPCLFASSLWIFIAILDMAMKGKVDCNLFQCKEDRLQAGD